MTVGSLPGRLFGVITRRIILERHERRLLLLMGALVATLFCAYTIAKVIRDALFLSEFGALALPYGYIGVALAASGFVWLESRVALRFKRVGATRFHQYAAIGFSLVAAAVYPLARHWTTAVFYVWAGSQAMMLLPHFWSLALDVWDSRRARVVLPLLGGCGLLGGLLGGAFAGWATPTVTRVGLMWSLSGLLIVAFFLTRVIEGHRASRPRPIEVSSTVSPWKIIGRSPYIKILAAALALSVIVSTLVDFQFKVYIQRLYPDPHALTQFLGKFYVGLNALALVFQFSVGGWLIYRLGLGRSNALQPVTAILFVSGLALGAGWWIVVGLRWIQGVVFQTLGKSSAEIYFMAVGSRERRRIKPAVDTLVDRWSDAVVGLLLIVLLRVMGVGVAVVAGLTLAFVAGWIVVLVVLHRAYGRAFEQTLSSRWLEPDVAEESMRVPSARKALREGLHADDESRIVLALKLSERSGDKEIARAVRGCIRHSSPSVRAAAVEAMEAMRLRDEDGVIRGFITEPHEGLRRAAIRYLLARDPRPADLARKWLDGTDAVLRQETVDALFDGPSEARAALTLEWVDARLQAGTREDLLVAARALGTMTGDAPVQRLRTLLANPDVEVRRVALGSAEHRPSPELLEALLSLLLLPEVSYEARRALAALGNPAVPALKRLLDGERGAKAQRLAARTLARLASPRSVGALMAIVKSPEANLRDIGYQSLTRVRVNANKPVLPRSAAHRLFLRELGEYRGFLQRTQLIEGEVPPEVRLLADTFRESSESALHRALGALACWYEPKPLSGAFERLKSSDVSVVAPALEYLGHVLPHKVFQHVSRIFEQGPKKTETAVAEGEPLAEAIRLAWRSDDVWLRACAVRASRHAQALDRSLFATGGGDDPLVQAELASFSAGVRASDGLAAESAPPSPGVAC
jgi:ATP/ADP translocase/HEAT repeat protein